MTPTFSTLSRPKALRAQLSATASSTISLSPIASRLSGRASTQCFMVLKPTRKVTMGIATHEHESTGPSLDLVLELNGEWHAEQVTSGIGDPNSGGNTIFLSPGLRLSQDKWSSFVSVGIPIVDNLNGIQSEPDLRIIAGATWLFEPPGP